MANKENILSLSPRSKIHPFYKFIFQLADLLEIDDYECYYFFVCPWGSGTDYDELLDIEYQARNIILYAEDNLVGKTPHIWYEEIRPYGLVQIEKLCERHPDRNFILVNIQYDLQKLVTAKNLRCVGLLPIGQITKESRANVTACLEKEEVGHKKWISFNHSPSHSRICTLSYLLYKNLDKHGNILVSDRIIELCGPYDSASEFTFYVLNNHLRKILKKGFQKLKIEDFETMALPPYDEEKQNDDFSNYRSIFEAYKKTRLEIITSSLYSEPTPQISEKEIQGIYGCNFMIIIGNPNMVKLLKKWGFDMFDDIVNHSYDSVINPSQRMFMAIDDNIHLLNGTRDLDKLWKINQHRFAANCELADRLHVLVENNFFQDFCAALNQLGIPYNKQIKIDDLHL